MCSDDEWRYDDGHINYDGTPINENPIGVDGIFC